MSTRGNPTDAQVDAILSRARKAADLLPDTPVAVATEAEAPPPVTDAARPPNEGAELLDAVADLLARYVAFPSPAARAAVALWAAHTHAITAFESTPRLALLSPEKGSGKTRTLEVLELLVPKPMHAVNTTAATLFRAVEAHQPVILFDECDTYFGPMARGEHEELRGLVNAGHRRGAVAYRCVGDPKLMEVKAFPAFCAVALAGIGDLPPTILDRAVLVKMRRRAPSEHVEPFRRRKAQKAAEDLRDGLAGWMEAHRDHLAEAEPEMPPGLVDRPADVWEALLAIADLAGGAWPADARRAAVELNDARAEADPSLGIALLRDLRAVFGQAESLSTEEVLRRLCALVESPWGDLRGKPLDARGLARRLKPYEVRPTTIRAGEATPKGYRREDLHDAWTRYLPDTPQASATSATPPTVSPVADVALPGGETGVADEHPAKRDRCEILWCSVKRSGGVNWRPCRKRAAKGTEIRVDGTDRRLCPEHRQQVERAVSAGMADHFRWQTQ